MNQLKSVLYTAVVTSVGGRSGSSKSDDGRLQLDLSTPKALGGDDGQGTNPEQLFAAGYSACFIGALKVVAEQMQVTLGDDVEVGAEVAIGQIEQGFGIGVKLSVGLPGMPEQQANELINAAHQICPYSNATRGNVDVQLSLKSA